MHPRLLRPSIAVAHAGLAPALATAICLLASCATPAPITPAPANAPAVVPTVTRGEFTIAATKLDAWNAVGQIVVNTNGATYEGRSQMLDLYPVR